jgi:mannose-6-phosphate isomerase-like protein (cupin superfamily)
VAGSTTSVVESKPAEADIGLSGVNGIGAVPSAAQVTFSRAGYAGPITVFTPSECRALLARLRRYPAPHPADWFKGFAATNRAFYDVGTYRPLLEAVVERLGPDVMLWGAHLVRRVPGQTHHWHTDIESSNPAGRTLSVWIGLEGTTQASSLRVIAGSHRLGVTIQEVAQQQGHERHERGSDDVLAWARERDPSCEMIRPDMTDGQALLFDGRVWHGSHNDNAGAARTALVLQYAAPDTPIFIPDLTRVEWPFRNLPSPRPACIMVSGSDRPGGGTNRIVPPPAAPERGECVRLSTRIETLAMPLVGDPERGHKPYKLFRGSTPNASDMACHVSVLSPGVTPHPPHGHVEEEILVMLAGEADLTIVGGPIPGTHRLRPGTFVYYPAQQSHTITAAGDGPATYLMFKWHARRAGHDGNLKTSIHNFLDDASGARSAGGAGGYRALRILDGRTELLRKLHCHLTTLAPRGGYVSHVDAHDVAILTVRGTVETMGQRVGPNSVIYYAGGEPHDMRNVGDDPAAYLVFEFHGSNDVAVDPTDAAAKARAGLPRRAARFVKRHVRKLLGRSGK